MVEFFLQLIVASLIKVLTLFIFPECMTRTDLTKYVVTMDSDHLSVFQNLLIWDFQLMFSHGFRHLQAFSSVC